MQYVTMELSLADEVGDRSNRRSESSSYSCLAVKGNALRVTSLPLGRGTVMPLFLTIIWSSQLS